MSKAIDDVIANDSGRLQPRAGHQSMTMNTTTGKWQKLRRAMRIAALKRIKNGNGAPKQGESRSCGLGRLHGGSQRADAETLCALLRSSLPRLSAWID